LGQGFDDGVLNAAEFFGVGGAEAMGVVSVEEVEVGELVILEVERAERSGTGVDVFYGGLFLGGGWGDRGVDDLGWGRIAVG
jgi:hypothetical protein